ncbi:MAG: hypothetical protein JO101_06125, partial [Candidatus Eremiobacteraeota bacterium]|nr:hypothetical protein [Candidatus Eremiobacteraeota bacterium]
AHEGVARAATVLDRTGSEPRLVAYLLPDAGAGDFDGLRAHLAARLPQHMIPGALATVDAFPLTPTGKLDRKALAARSIPLREPRGDPEPSTELERKLAGLFAELLGVERVGLDENFFRAGGHSLLAARLVARIEREFPEDVARLEANDGRSPLLALFYVEPTIRGTAATLTRARLVESGPLVELRRGDPSRTPLFWLHGMYNGDGLYSWNMVEPLDDGQPVWLVHPHGHDNAPFPDDVSSLAAERVEAIRAVRPQGPYRIGGFCTGGVVAFEIARQLQDAGEVVESVVMVSPPPWVASWPRLLAVSSTLCGAAGLDEERRSFINAYLYQYAERLDRFAHGDGRRRLAQARHAIVLGRRKLSRLRRWRRAEGNSEGAGNASGRPAPFADPGFKTDWYVRTMRNYVPLQYHGRVDVIRGRESVGGYDDPTNGWHRCAEEWRAHVVPGGHFCVVDAPQAVGAVLKDIIAGA